MNAIEMEHAGTKALHAFWSKHRAGRSAPYRAEVTQATLGRALCARVLVVEALGPGDYRIRRCGDALFDLFGMELRGMRPDALMEGESRAGFLEFADGIREAGAVGVARAAAGPLGIEFLFAPLLSDFGRADLLLGGVHVIGSPQVERAARRCRLLRTGRIGEAGAPPKRAAPLPGFAESAAPFGHDRPVLKSVAGDGAGRGARRRDHLKIVEE